MAAEGYDANADDVHYGHVGGLLLRAGSTAIRYELINAHLAARDIGYLCIDANHIGKYERGQHIWPQRAYRDALRAILGAASDAVIGPLDGIVVVALALRYAGRQVPREVLLAAWPGEPRLLERLLGPTKSADSTDQAPESPACQRLGHKRRDLR